MGANPFRSFGRPAVDEQFVDRPALVRKVTSVWQDPGRPGNLSVVGHPRTGRTSLVLHALAQMERTDLIVVRTDITRHTSALGFFQSIAHDVVDKLPELRPALEPVRAAGEWYDLEIAVTALFRQVVVYDRHVLLVLDEFDRAPLVLAHLSAFQLLRSLASEPDHPVGLITVTRRPVIEIEIDAAGGSRLDGVLTEKCHVGMFAPGEAARMIDRAKPAVDLTGVAGELMHRSGRHPFLLQVLCHQVVETFRETGSVDVAAAAAMVRDTYRTYFDRLVQAIDADTGGQGSAALRTIAAGERPDPLALQRLLLTGIAEEADGGPRLFTEELTHHLRGQSGDAAAPAEDRHEPCVVLAVATEWSSQHGGLSTLNRQLCLGLAAHGVPVYCVVLATTGAEVAEAGRQGVVLLHRAPVAGASEASVLQRRPELPAGVNPTVIIGHGRVTGPAALIQGEDHFPEARRLHFVHMAPDEIEFHKLDRTDDIAETAEARTNIEVSLGRRASRVVAVGPRLHGRYHGYLSGRDDVAPLRFDPGFDLPDARPRPVPGGTPLTVLTAGRMEDRSLKGLDIALRACAQVAEWRHERKLRGVELVVRGLPAGSAESQLARMRELAGTARLGIVPRNYTRESRALTEDLERASVFVMPSRAEGFGLVGLEAIVAGTPALISAESGLGELLAEIFDPEQAALWVVPVYDDPDRDTGTWARAIERVLLDRESAFDRAEDLRHTLAERFSWSGAAAELLRCIGR